MCWFTVPMKHFYGEEYKTGNICTLNQSDQHHHHPEKRYKENQKSFSQISSLITIL